MTHQVFGRASAQLSSAVRAGGFVFIPDWAPVGPNGWHVGGTIEGQIHQMLDDVSAAPKLAGCEMTGVEIGAVACKPLATTA